MQEKLNSLGLLSESEGKLEWKQVIKKVQAQEEAKKKDLKFFIQSMINEVEEKNSFLLI